MHELSLHAILSEASLYSISISIKSMFFGAVIGSVGLDSIPVIGRSGLNTALNPWIGRLMPLLSP